MQSEQTLANKSHDYWATMRSNLNLLWRSDLVKERQIEEIQEELSDILESGILSYPQTLSQVGMDKPGFGIMDKMPYNVKRALLGFEKYQPVLSENELKFVKSLAYKAQDMRKSNWSWRISQEAEEKEQKDWHPFFVTLTVDPKKGDPEQIWREGREFRKYIRRLVNVVCKELEHPPAHKRVIKDGEIIWDYRPESDYVTYAGVIEHGKSREHHHGHFIIWLRCCPSSWCVCPNASIRDPSNRKKRECVQMRSLWPWSGYCPITRKYLSPAMYFRTLGDIWERKYNFVLPLDDKGQPIKMTPARVSGAYMMKYFSKEFKEWKHRVKATRNLGLNSLRKMLMTFPSSVTEALTWRAKNSGQNLSLMTTHSVPLGLMRQEAKRIDYLNRYMEKRLDLKTLLQSNIGIYTKMLNSVQDGARPERMHSSEFFDWVARLLPDIREFSESRFLAAHVAVSDYFPPVRKKKEHVKIGANRI